MAQIIDMLETEADIVGGTIYTCPPQNHMLSDEDSGEEDTTTGDLNRLTGNQLRSEAEVVVTKRFEDTLRVERMGDGDSTDDDDDNIPLSEMVPTPSTSRTSQSGSRTKPVVRNWREEDLATYKRQEWVRPDFLEENKSPVEWFELFYNEDVVNLLVECSNQYAVFTGNTHFEVTKEEMRLVLGICLISGYCVYSRNRMYWDTGSDTYRPGVPNSISRNRFEQIIRFMHVCDNADLDPADKFTKVRPLWVALNQKWMQFSPNFPEVSIDESMIPYYDHHSTKQHIHGKPIRFGYKCWYMATRLGYVIQAEPYQGASTGNTNPTLGVGGSVVTNLLASLPADFKVHVYIDNFFTSLRLLASLKESGHHGTGTIRVNRVEKAPLKSLNVIKKQPRGSFHQLVDATSGISLVQYNDNNVVVVASTAEGVMPMGSAQRWSRVDKKKCKFSSHCVFNNTTGLWGV